MRRLVHHQARTTHACHLDAIGQDLPVGAAASAVRRLRRSSRLHQRVARQIVHLGPHDPKGLVCARSPAHEPVRQVARGFRALDSSYQTTTYQSIDKLKHSTSKGNTPQISRCNRLYAAKELLARTPRSCSRLRSGTRTCARQYSEDVLVVTFRHKGAGYFRHIGASGSGQKRASWEVQEWGVSCRLQGSNGGPEGAAGCDRSGRRARGNKRCDAGGRAWRKPAGDWKETPDPIRSDRDCW